MRETQFFWLLATYLPFFVAQKSDVKFYIINQGLALNPKNSMQVICNVLFLGGHPETPFNRAKLFNAGFKIAVEDEAYDCFFFSDIDLVPLDDQTPLRCIAEPRHYSEKAQNRFNII